MKKFLISTILLFLIPLTLSSVLLAQQEKAGVHDRASILCGAAQAERYLPLIGDKQIGLVANHTSVVGQEHLVDFLLQKGVEKEQIIAVFAPEHGFRGRHAAGAKVRDGVDMQTGLRVLSLYGKNKKPSHEMLEGIELMLFDMQDVGARFYTYISTLHYVMEACAEQGIPLLVLDRPNPNGDYVDGPVLDTAWRSFVGMHPIPVVHGLTMGELAGMINGEGWLSDGVRCELQVIPCSNYHHGLPYELPVSPSPNLQNMHAIRLYPSTCFFEGTVLSEGRGTPWPFEVYGHPELDGDFEFTPVAIPGVANYPKWEGQLCRGRDLRAYDTPARQLDLDLLLSAYKSFDDKGSFFKPFFDKLAGSDRLRQQIEAGCSTKEIRASWKKDLNVYLQRRNLYLLYEPSEYAE